MASRLELHNKLTELLGKNNVYYQPPESVKMEYPAIRYSLSKIENRRADDTSYLMTNCYDITVIDRRPDNPVIKELLRMPMCSYGRHYSSDNLDHTTLTLYY